MKVVAWQGRPCMGVATTDLPRIERMKTIFIFMGNFPTQGNSYPSKELLFSFRVSAIFCTSFLYK